MTDVADASPAEHSDPPRRGLRIGVIVLGALILIGVGYLASASSEKGTGSTLKEAWDLPRIEGDGRVRLVDFRGQPVVLNFFASWCTSCDFELPGFARVSTELKGKIAFIGVDALETGERMYMPRRHGITWWPLGRDINGSNGSGLHEALGGGNAMPITAFYDEKGNLLEVSRGALPESSLRSKLAELYGV